MPANINTYIGRQSAWHKSGIVTGHYMTWNEICATPGMDFDVEKLQLTHPATGCPVDGYGIFRTDNGALLGTVSKDYSYIHHSRGFGMIDALIASADGAHYESAGVIGAGEKVWGLADLVFAVKVGDDVSKTYLAFMTGYDGKISHQYRLVNERIVCENTFDIALGEKTTGKFRIRHTGDANKRLDDAHAVLADIADEVHSVEEKLNFLAQRKVTRESMTSILDRLFPSKTRNAETGELVTTTRRANILAEVLSIYETNDNDAFPEQRGSAYNLLNSITNYVDHVRPAQNGKRAEQAAYGTGAKLKTAAYEVILQTAQDMPAMSRQMVVATAPVTTTGSALLDEIAEFTNA
jgi:phage/plasmid-like protein (TIGR03299 family)